MDFKIISQELIYSRYLQLYNSRVQYPNSKEFEFDVCCSRSRLFVVVFPYFPKTNTVRVIREYCQGVNELRYSLPSGGFDPKKHSSARECAVHELREEAFLADGEMVDLLSSKELDNNGKSVIKNGTSADRGIPELKWSMNRFIPFICIDPGVTSDEDLRDEEEFILTQDVSLQEFKSLMLRGEMMLPSVQCGIMALDYIERKI